MTQVRKSFTYDTLRQGYDVNLWRTLAGVPTSDANGRIQVGPNGAAINYADITKGDVTFDINTPTAPEGAFKRYFGLSNANATKYIRFEIGANLLCETANDGVAVNSPVIVWDANWEGVNTKFQILWQSGFVKFLIDGARVYQVSDASIPHGPLSLYLYDNSTSPMSAGDMVVKGSQSIVFNPATTDHHVIISSSPSVSPSVSASPSKSESKSPSLSPSSSPSVSPSISASPSLSESVSPSVSASPSASESVSPSISESPSASESASPSVSLSKSPSVSPSGSKSSSVSPSISLSQSKSPSRSPSPSLSPSL